MGLYKLCGSWLFLHSFFSTKFKGQVGEQEEDADLWIGYSAFHLGDYKRALEVRWGNPVPRGWKLGCCDKAMTTGGRCSVTGSNSAIQLRYKCMVIRQMLWKAVWIGKKKAFAYENRTFLMLSPVWFSTRLCSLICPFKCHSSCPKFSIPFLQLAFHIFAFQV